MNPSRDKIVFWSLVAVQAAGAITILWNGIPVYRQLLAPGPQSAELGTFALAIAAVLLMQAAYWLAFRIQPRLRFQKHVLLGHVVLCFGELSFFFANALATVIVFERLEEVLLGRRKIAELHLDVTERRAGVFSFLSNVGKVRIASQPFV